MVRARKLDEALDGFFRPFFQTGAGHIFTLSEPGQHMRDGLAAAQIARYFPLPEFRDILIEPGRPSIMPAPNVILVGWSKLFVEPRKHAATGKRLLSARLRERIERIQRGCCYEFRRGRRVAMVNRVTGDTYVPEKKTRGTEVDYGVIRRLFRGPSENTVILEGLHWLGTLGAVQAITDRDLLAAIWRARCELGKVRDSLPLEILVRTTFQPELSDGIHAFEAIRTTPLHVVFDRHWIRDLSEEGEWRDQRPWDVNLLVNGGDSPVPVGAGYRPRVPRLEVQADVTDLNPRARDLCRRLLADLPGVAAFSLARTRQQADRLLDLLTREAGRFRIVLVEVSGRGGSVQETVLPQGGSRIRQWRKRFIVHLILCRLLGKSFHNDADTIRRVFPEIAREAGREDPTQRFPNRITGKIREGFGPLFGEASKPTGYADLDRKRATRLFELRLQIPMMFRMRL